MAVQHDLDTTSQASASPDPLRIVVAVPGNLAERDCHHLQEAGLEVLAQAGSARTLARLLATAGLAAPQVVLVHQALDRLDRYPDLPERIATRWGAAAVLLVPHNVPTREACTDDTSPHVAVALAARLRAKNSGYAGVAVWPADPDDLYDAALAALSATPAPHGSAATAAPVVEGTPAAPLKAPALLVGMRGEKGGTGKTMVAENLCALAARAGLRALLLDMDQNGSTLAPVLREVGAPGTGKGILAYLAAYNIWRTRPDAGVRAAVGKAAELLGATTVRYPPHVGGGLSAFDVLPGVRGGDQGDLLDQDEHLEALDMLIQAARERYDLIVVDMGQSHLHALHQGWAAEADKLVVVTEPKFRSVVRAAEGQVKLMNAIGKDGNQCCIVVNRVRNSRYEMVTADLRARFSRGLGEEDAGGSRANAGRASRRSAMPIIGMLRDAPDLVDEGEYHHVPWVLLPRAEHHQLMDDLYELANNLLGAGVLPPRRAHAVALARIRTAMGRLFHPQGNANDGLAGLPVQSSEQPPNTAPQSAEHGAGGVPGDSTGWDGNSPTIGELGGPSAAAPGFPAPASPGPATTPGCDSSAGDGRADAGQPMLPAERRLSRARRQRARTPADADGHGEPSPPPGASDAPHGVPL